MKTFEETITAETVAEFMRSREFDSFFPEDGNVEIYISMDDDGELRNICFSADCITVSATVTDYDLTGYGNPSEFWEDFLKDPEFDRIAAELADKLIEETEER
jgi:hypothetical protein